MPRCILCLNERELTERHILPFSMGGALTHRLVCEDCNQVIDKTIDVPFLNSILPQLFGDTHKLQSKKNAASSAIARLGVERQLSLNFEERAALVVDQLAVSQSSANDLALEAIKVAYELVALEFGEAYVVSSPVAIKLREAISEARCNEISFKPNVDLGPLSSMLSREGISCLLLFQNACIISIFGTTFTVEYCLASEPFVRSTDNAVLYVIDPVKQSHAKYLLVDYLAMQSQN